MLWARSQSDHFALKSILLQNGANLISLTEQIEDTPTGRFLEGVFSGLAQLDNELKGERVRACLITKALDGWYPGKCPYGYITDKNTKKVIRDPEYFEHIKKILIDFSHGMSIPNLVSYLNKAGVKTKATKRYISKDFTPKSVWKILTKSKFYAGTYDWSDEKDIKGKHEPMITWNEHLKIQSLLYNKETVRTADEDGDYFYLNFTTGHNEGFLKCGNCGNRMRSCFSKGKMGKKYPYYYCYKGKCNAKKKSHAKQTMEKEFEKLIGNISPTKEYVDIFKDEVLKAWEEDHSDYEKRYKLAKEKVESLEFEKSETIRMKRRGEITLEEYEVEITKLRNEITVAQLVENENKIDKNKLEVLLTQAELFLTNIDPCIAASVQEISNFSLTLHSQKVLCGKMANIEPLRLLIYSVF